MDKEELARLIEAKLPVDASREALHQHIRGQQKLIGYLAQALAAQGNSILQLREMQAAQAGAIEFLGNMVGAEPDEGPLAAITNPKLVGLDGRKLS